MEAIARLESLEVHTGNIHVGGKAKVPSTSTSKDVSRFEQKCTHILFLINIRCLDGI